MSDGYVARRGGWDGPNRIATTAEMVTQATETVLPGETMYQPIPFYPAITSGSGGSIGSGVSTDTWVNTPSRLDLTWYQGDDVTIPLTIEDPADTTPDMSTEWEWTSQIRTWHSYHALLVKTFAVKDEYTPPVVGVPPEPDTPGFTLVTLFLPRSENLYIGEYRWDLYSLSPIDVTGFDQPPEVIDPEPWPPTDQIRTWLYGKITVLPRVTSTDWLPYPAIDSGDGGGPGGVIPHYFVGPNGRVL